MTSPNTVLVVLDFRTGTAHRFFNRIRTHRAKIEYGVSVEEIEAFRIEPDGAPVTPGTPPLRVA